MWFTKKSVPKDPLTTAKGRKEAIEKLEELGYFVRKKSIRRPKPGDTIRFRVGAGWSINTHYYQTGLVEEITKDGYVKAIKRKKNNDLVAMHFVHPYLVVSVSKAKAAK